MAVNHLFFYLFILLSIFTICRSLRFLILFAAQSICLVNYFECCGPGNIYMQDDPDCVYTVYVRTGSTIKGGTDSIISLTLHDANGYGIRISNLEAWGGLMGSGHDYFEGGNLDIFSGRGPCLTGPHCAMNLTSDGMGSGHGWYCNYIEVTSTGVHKHCAHNQFTVEQWLATDTWPYELSAITNYCSSDGNILQNSAKI